MWCAIIAKDRPADQQPTKNVETFRLVFLKAAVLELEADRREAI